MAYELRKDEAPVQDAEATTAVEHLKREEAVEDSSAIATPFENEERHAGNTIVEAERSRSEQLVGSEVEKNELEQELKRVTSEISEAGEKADQEPGKQGLGAKSEPELVTRNGKPELLKASLEDDISSQPSLQLPTEAPSYEVRQATQAAPTQTSTQQNFVQQLIQPIGQLFSQITGQAQQKPPSQVANDEPVAPGPTIPGFLNPANAITSAQQAVQNVVNSTTQAFQGLQQLATNIGTTFQNTLSSLGGQQSQLSTADSTSPRPPGPIQSIVGNLIGGNQQNPPDSPNQPQGPLQGIISFFQGGNRPQSTVAPTSTTQPQKVETATADPTNGIDDKIGAAEHPSGQGHQDVTNEVRRGEEDGDVVGDSFEESQPDEIIVVNDDTEEVVA